MLKSKWLLATLVTFATLQCAQASPQHVAPSSVKVTAKPVSAAGLVGKWKSVDAKNGALHGEIVLNANQSASMQAQKGNLDIETPLMTGTWKADNSQLVLTLPPYGTSKMKYTLSGNKLILTYENNNEQTFERVAK